MSEQVQNLEAIFKRRDVNADIDNGDDNSFGEHWELINPDDLEYWSLELIPMTDRTYFVHKFRDSAAELPILYEGKVKDVLPDSEGILLVHCETTGEEAYMFTIYLEYAKAKFHLPMFLKSLENSTYESLLKEVESQVDQKKWVNKNGHPLGIKSMASKIRQLLISMTAVIASRRYVSEKMKPADLTR
jgi:hypothetical protein